MPEGKSWLFSIVCSSLIIASQAFRFAPSPPAEIGSFDLAQPVSKSVPAVAKTKPHDAAPLQSDGVDRAREWRAASRKSGSGSSAAARLSASVGSTDEGKSISATCTGPPRRRIATLRTGSGLPAEQQGK